METTKISVKKIHPLLMLALGLFALVFIAKTPLVFATCSSSSGGPAGGGGSAQGDGTAGTSGSIGCGGGGGGGGGSAGGGNGTAGAGGGVLLKSSGSMSISGSIDARGGDSSTTNGGTVKLFTCDFPSTSGISYGRLYQTGTSANCPPSAPVLIYPLSSSNGNSVYTVFKARSADKESDYLEYWIDVCADSGCSTIIRSICQTSAGTGAPGTCSSSQTGWSGQDQQSGVAYSGNSDLSFSQLATHNYQPPYLDKNTTFWWRAYAIDPGGSNTWGSSSVIQ